MYFALTTNKVDTDGIADLHIRDVFRLHGLPRGTISDRGLQFMSRFIKALYEKLGVNGQLTTVYHAQVNRQTERMNKEIEQYLWLFTRQRQNDWATLLPVGEFTINSCVQSASSTYCSRSYTAISLTSLSPPVDVVTSPQSTNTSTGSKKHKLMPKQHFNEARKRWPEMASHHGNSRLETRSGLMPTKFRYTRQAKG